MAFWADTLEEEVLASKAGAPGPGVCSPVGMGDARDEKGIEDKTPPPTVLLQLQGSVTQTFLERS